MTTGGERRIDAMLQTLRGLECGVYGITHDNRTVQQRIGRLEADLEMGPGFEQGTTKLCAFNRVSRLESAFATRTKAIGKWELDLFGERNEGSLQERWLILKRHIG